MARGHRHKKRLLKVLDILRRETDADHRLSLTELMERLGMWASDENGRRNVRDDIRALREAGWPIATERHKATEYYLARRRLSAKELKVLVDLVQSSRAIPQNMSDDLVESLLSLGSEHEAQAVDTRIRAENRAKLFNEDLFDNIWELKRAMDGRHKVRFRYFHPDFHFEPAYDGAPGDEWLEETPLLLTCVDGMHYVITYSDEREMELTRRVDRMTEVKTSQAKATWRPELQDYDLDERRLFGMYHGKVESVTLHVKERAMGPLMDRFGRDMHVSNICEVEEDGSIVRYADVTVRVEMSKQFEGWIFGLGDLVKRVDRRAG